MNQRGNRALLNRLGQLADNREAVARLRELVMELAVQGKLVAQIRDDGSAIDLLSAISRERAAGAGKVRRPEDQPPTTDDPHPFEIPSNWEWTKLGKVALQIQYGYTASADPNATEVRMLRITDIQNNRVDWPSVPGCQIDAVETERYLLVPNDILIARTGGTIGKSFIVPDAPMKSVFASYLIRVTPPRAIAARYLKTFLESPLYWAQLREMSAGTGQPNVNGQALGRLELPLPPLAEQKRIVAKVDELMALCDRLEAQLKSRNEKHATLARAALARFADAPTPANLELLFHDSFTISPADLRNTILTLAVQGRLVSQDPDDEPPDVPTDGEPVGDSEWVWRLQLPDTWQWARFGSLLAVLKNGFNGKPSKVVGKFKVTRIETIARESIDMTRVGYADDLTGDVVAKHAVMKGDILFSHINSEPHLGKTAICTVDDPTLVHGVNLLLLRPIAAIDPRYLNIALRELRSSGYFVSIAQRAVNQASINQKNLGKTPVPVPPLAEQRRIVAKVDQLMALVDKLETQLTASRATADQLLSAVVGELTGA